MKSFTGIGASDGIVIGTAHVWRRPSPVLRRVSLVDRSPEEELHRLHQALDTTSAELLSLREQLRERLGADNASILDAQVLLLEDEE